MCATKYAVTFLPFGFTQAACEKTASVMHHVIKRTMTYANGRVCVCVCGS